MGDSPYLDSRHPVAGYTADNPPPLWLYEPRFPRQYDIVQMSEISEYRNILPERLKHHQEDKRPPNLSFPMLYDAQSSMEGQDPVPIGYPPRGDKLEWLLHRFDNLPLHKAVVGMGEATLEEVIALKKQASRNKSSISTFCPTTGETALHVAAACANHAAVRILLSSGIYSIDVMDKAGMTPLVYLSWFSAEPFHTSRIEGKDISECFSVLVSCGADMIRRHTLEGAMYKMRIWPTGTPLEWAARSWNTPFIKACNIFAKSNDIDFFSTDPLWAPAHIELRPDELPSSALNERWSEKLKIMNELWCERYYIFRSQEWWEKDIKSVVSNRYEEGDIERLYGHLRGQVPDIADPRRLHPSNYMDMIRQSMWMFGPRHYSYVQPYPDPLQQSSFYAWDFSSSRLTLSRQSEQAHTNVEQACTPSLIRHWKESVRELRACGARVDLRESLLRPDGMFLPVTCFLYLFDLFIEQEPRNGVPWPSNQVMPRKIKLDMHALLHRQILDDHIGFGTIFSLAMETYAADGRPTADFLTLLRGLVERGLDLTEKVHSSIIPFHCAPSEGWHGWALSQEVNWQVTSFVPVAQSATTQEEMWEAKRLHLCQPVPLLGFLLFKKRVAVVEALLDAGMVVALPSIIDAHIEWKSYLPPDCEMMKSTALQALVKRLESLLG